MNKLLIGTNEYNSKGELVYVKKADGQDFYIEHHSNGKVDSVLLKDNIGNISLYEFDSGGNKIHQSDYHYNHEHCWEYDSHGNLIHEKDSLGFETNFEIKYDPNGRKIYQKSSDGQEEWWTYDSEGRNVNWKNSDGLKKTIIYNENCYLIQQTDSYGHEHMYEYDLNGNILYEKTSLNYEKWFEYDSDGHEIHSKDSYGRESWKEYDANRNEIHCRNSDGSEIWYEYEYDSNNKIIKKSTYLPGYCDSKKVKKLSGLKMYDSSGKTICERILINRFTDNLSDYLSYWDENFYQYDSFGQEAYCKETDGLELWIDSEYDSHRTLISKQCNVFGEVKSESDFIGNLINYIYSHDCEKWSESDLDIQGHETFFHFKFSDGTDFLIKNYRGNDVYIKYSLCINFSPVFEQWNEFDSYDNKVYSKTNDIEEWFEYDKDFNLIHSYDSNGHEEWFEYEYDSDNHITKKWMY